MASRLKNLSVTKVALVDAGANQEADVVIFKAQQMADHPYAGDGNVCADCGMPREQHPMTKSAETPEQKEAPVADTPTDEVVEETVAKADYDALAAELDAIKASIADSTDVEDIDKSALPEAVRKALDEAETLKATVAKMQHDARIATFRKQAEDDFGHLGNPDDLGPALEEIDRVAPDAAQTIVQTLKAAAARMDTNELFKELGRSGETGGNEAETLIQAEIAKGATRVEAMQKVFAANPALYPEPGVGADA